MLNIKIITTLEGKVARGLANVVAGFDRPMAREYILGIGANTTPQSGLALAVDAVNLSREVGGMAGKPYVDRMVLEVLKAGEPLTVRSARELKVRLLSELNIRC